MTDKSKIRSNKDKKTRWIGLGILAIVGIVVIGVIGTMYLGENGVPESEHRVTEVLESPSEFFGRDVTLTGDVENVFGSRAMTLDSPDPFTGELLVISRQSLEPIGGGGPEDYLFGPDDRISVEGSMREFNLREIEEELGADLVDEQFVNWEGRPVIIADSVDFER